jgi:hypothetical protein
VSQELANLRCKRPGQLLSRNPVDSEVDSPCLIQNVLPRAVTVMGEVSHVQSASASIAWRVSAEWLADRRMASAPKEFSLGPATVLWAGSQLWLALGERRSYERAAVHACRAALAQCTCHL